MDKKANNSLYIRIAVAVAVFIAALVACLLILKHENDPERKAISGTYVCDRTYTFIVNSDAYESPATRYAVEFCEDGTYLYRGESGKSGGYYVIEGDTMQTYSEGVEQDKLDIKMNGSDMALSCTRVIKVSGPELVEYIGEENARKYLGASLEEQVCEALITGNVALLSGTDMENANVSEIRIAANGVKVKETLTFLTKDTGLSYDKAMELYND